MTQEIIVTGAAGFIGSHLVKFLLNNHFSVIGIDNFSDYYSKKIKKFNLSPFLKSERFKFFEFDLSKPGLEKNIRKADIIIHLAAQPGVRGSWGDSFNIYVKDNILALQKLLEWSVQNKIDKFIFASSSSVYGDTDTLPMDENKSIPVPVSPYGSTKLMGENLCRIYHQNFSLEYYCLRFFSVYGPAQRPDMAFSKLFRAALTGTEFNLFGDGKQTRDFTYIDDIIHGISRTLDLKEKNTVYLILAAGPEFQ
ncbi:MAG: NAD-dependent epimerase/dehydratase family protein [bacterium]|nr:NAD-dependent epimerase/dehydratase family protein [bacterium]